MYSLDDIMLRRVVGADAPLLLKWENNQENWRVSDRSESLTLNDLAVFIEEQENALTTLDQIRFMIVERRTRNCIGTIDLYEIDWKLDSGYVGILIAEKANRRRGAAVHSLLLLERLALEQLELECLLARIHKDNKGSQALFTRAGFKKKIDNFNLDKADAAFVDCNIFEKWLNE
jgi:diamine N-acetyltransferase